MSESPYELLARFNANGTVAGVHTKRLIEINGVTVEGPAVPLADETHPAFTRFQEGFAAKAVSERDLLQTQVQTLQARIAQLEAALPWNPRVMEAKHFVARITPNEMLSLAGSSDVTVQSILGMLKDWVANDWPVVLDSPEMQQAIGYLGVIKMVTQERVAELLKDCTKDEAYIADGK